MQLTGKSHGWVFLLLSRYPGESLSVYEQLSNLMRPGRLQPQQNIETNNWEHNLSKHGASKERGIVLVWSASSQSIRSQDSKSSRQLTVIPCEGQLVFLKNHYEAGNQLSPRGTVPEFFNSSASVRFCSNKIWQAHLMISLSANSSVIRSNMGLEQNFSFLNCLSAAAARINCERTWKPQMIKMNITAVGRGTLYGLQGDFTVPVLHL